MLLKTSHCLFKVDLLPVACCNDTQVGVSVLGIGARIPRGHGIVKRVVFNDNDLVIRRLVLLHAEETSCKVKADKKKSIVIICDKR